MEDLIIFLIIFAIFVLLLMFATKPNNNDEIYKDKISFLRGENNKCRWIRFDEFNFSKKTGTNWKCEKCGIIAASYDGKPPKECKSNTIEKGI